MQAARCAITTLWTITEALSLFAKGRRRGTLGGLADGAANGRGCGKPVAGPDPLRRQTLVCRDWCPRRLGSSLRRRPDPVAPRRSVRSRFVA